MSCKIKLYGNIHNPNGHISKERVCLKKLVCAKDGACQGCNITNVQNNTYGVPHAVCNVPVQELYSASGVRRAL